MSSRIERDDLYLNMARLYSQRATCIKAHVGVVAVRDGRIIATGYNGAPSGMPHCTEVGCDIVAGHCLRTVHAEANVVAFAARAGVSLDGASLYCTHTPCITCAKLLINAGVKYVMIARFYDNQELSDGVELMQQLGVEVASRS